MSLDSPPPQDRRQRRRSEILEVIALREREGLTWKQVSERSGIPVGTLTSWQQKLRKEAGKAAGFVELAPAARTAPTDFTLETAAGLRIHVTAGFDAAALARLLSVVGPSC